MKEPIFDEIWDSVSFDCKDFVMRLLTKNPSKRLNATQALIHPWITKYQQMIELKQYQCCIKNPKFHVNDGANESLVSEIISIERWQRQWQPIHTTKT